MFVEEECFGEVEFESYPLHLLGADILTGGDFADGEGVALEAGAGEDVYCYEGELWHCCMCLLFTLFGYSFMLLFYKLTYNSCGVRWRL